MGYAVASILVRRGERACRLGWYKGYHSSFYAAVLLEVIAVDVSAVSNLVFSPYRYQ